MESDWNLDIQIIDLSIFTQLIDSNWIGYKFHLLSSPKENLTYYKYTFFFVKIVDGVVGGS